jgi:hypothetical protein|tara:strand:+ start:775 stop:948 length:174 start_codon:yes stop_codon:yes gene_type:complete
MRSNIVCYLAQPERLDAYLNLMPSAAMCGDNREQALLILSDLEVAILPLNNSAKEIL